MEGAHNNIAQIVNPRGFAVRQESQNWYARGSGGQPARGDNSAASLSVRLATA